MRSLLAALLQLLLPSRGLHRAGFEVPSRGRHPGLPSVRAVPPRPARPPLDVVLADGLPLVRPYVVLAEREREAQERWWAQRERRRAAVLATLGQDYLPREVAV